MLLRQAAEANLLNDDGGLDHDLVAVQQRREAVRSDGGRGCGPRVPRQCVPLLAAAATERLADVTGAVAHARPLQTHHPCEARELSHKRVQSRVLESVYDLT